MAVAVHDLPSPSTTSGPAMPSRSQFQSASGGFRTVTAETLLLVGSRDRDVLELNRRAAAILRCPHRLEVIEGAGHLFAEPGTLERVARLAAEWFGIYLSSSEPRLAAAGG